MKHDKDKPTGFEEKNKQDVFEPAPTQENIKKERSKIFEAALQAVENMGQKIKH